MSVLQLVAKTEEMAFAIPNLQVEENEDSANETDIPQVIVHHSIMKPHLA
jgi:hypothetical protein